MRKLHLLSAALLCAATTVAAQAQCSNRSLNGAYGYTVTGTIVSSTGPLVAGPFGAVGRLVFDGKGNVSTVRSLSDNGNILTGDSGTGTYTVNSDCTGSFTITVGPPGETILLNLNLVLDDTDQIRAIVTNPKIDLVLEGRKQFPVLYQ